MDIQLLKKEFYKIINLKKTPVFNREKGYFCRDYNYSVDSLNKYCHPRLVRELKDNKATLHTLLQLKENYEITYVTFNTSFNEYDGEKYIYVSSWCGFIITIYDKTKNVNDESSYEDKYIDDDVLANYVNYCNRKVMEDDNILEKIKNKDDIFVTSFDVFFEIFLKEQLINPEFISKFDASHEKFTEENIVKKFLFPF